MSSTSETPAVDSGVEQQVLPTRNRDVPPPLSDDMYTASTPIPELGYFLPKLDQSTLHVNTSVSRGMYEKRRVFNRYSQLLGQRATSEIPFKQAELVQQTADEIQQIIRNAEEAIQAKSTQFQSDIARFVSGVVTYSDPRWYRNVADLTAMDSLEFTDCIKSMRIPDPEDFCSYLRETLPKAAAQRMTYEEDGITGWSFPRKVNMLLDRVIKNTKEHRPAALSLFVFVKANVLLPHLPRVRSLLMQEEHARIDDTIFWLLGSYSDGDVSKQYWNFAENWRVLVNAWETLTYDTESLMSLVESFKEKAQIEIRYKTHLFVYGRLPTELADAVFEAAALAEEIPLETK